MINKVDSKIPCSNVSSLQLKQSEPSRVSTSLLSLHSLREKSSINPIKAVCNWLTNCLKAFWGLICTVCCCKKTSAVETKVEKKEENSNEETEIFSNDIPTLNDMFKCHILNYLNFLKFPEEYEKMIVHVQYGKEEYTKVFPKLLNFQLVGVVRKWIDSLKSETFATNDPNTHASCDIYVFYDKKEGSKTTPMLKIFGDDISGVGLRGIRSEEDKERPSSILTIGSHNVLLSAVFPWLQEQPVTVVEEYRLQEKKGTLHKINPETDDLEKIQYTYYEK